MHPKIVIRSASDSAPVSGVKPLLLHDVTKPTASANAASRRRMIPTQPAPGVANHARHHVSRDAQP